MQKEGGTFAANLSRVGEKDNYDYLVRWIHNPRQRTLPYCPFEKRDLTAEDYAKKGVPFVFDFDHTKCPNDGHELLVQQMTPMPSLRLEMGEVRDIASYLMTKKHGDASLRRRRLSRRSEAEGQGSVPGKELRLRGLP